MEGIAAIMDQVMGEAAGVEAVGVASGRFAMEGNFWKHRAVFSVLVSMTMTI